MEETTNVKVLDKSLTVLEALRTAKESIGVNELAKVCDLSSATTFRILKTLKNRGWVYQDEDEKYTVGYKLSYHPADPNNFWLILRETAYYTMFRLSAAEHEAMNLTVRDFDRCFILGQSRTKKMVDYVPPIGTVLPFHASAGGKILLSELNEQILNELFDLMDFKRITSNTITDRAVLVDELSRVRAKGYALDVQESQEEGFCISVPVRSKTDEIIAALSFSGFIGNKTALEIAYYVQLLKNASAEITEKVFRS